MPVASKKKTNAANGATPVPAKTPPKPGVEALALARPVIYPEVAFTICDGKRGADGELLPGHRERITAAFMERILNWETEEQYAARKDEEEPDKKGKVKWVFGDDPRTEHGEPVLLLTDLEGKKVVCWNNTTNRSFDRKRALGYAHDMLNRNWADSANGGTVKLPLHPDLGGGEVELPEMTMNGESIILSRTGRCVSIQHRGIALIWAEQIRNGANADHWKAIWPDDLSIEALMVVGVSDSPRVARTVDDIMPRTDADAISTVEFSEAAPEDKKELSKLLAAATSIVWKRTRVGDDEFAGQETNSQLDAFRANHPRLKEAVRHVFGENKNRSVSLAMGSAGRMAGLMYLFAASRSDGKKYRSPDSAADRSEDSLSFGAKVKLPDDVAKLSGKAEVSAWDASKWFVSRLADPKSKLSLAVASTLSKLAGAGEGGASTDEKIGTLCLAWSAFSEGKEPTPKELELSYVPKDGVKTICEHPRVGGIDLGKDSRAEKPMTKAEEAEAAKAIKAANDRKRSEDLAKKMADQQKAPGGIIDKFNGVAAKHPGKTMLMRTPAGSLASWGAHATAIRKACGMPAGVPGVDGVDRLAFTLKDLEAQLPKMLAAGLKVALIEEVTTNAKGAKEIKVTDQNGQATPAVPKPAPAKPAAVKK